MKLKQLSLFIENKPGELLRICRILKAHSISIRTLSLADTQQFGIVRLLVREWELAKKVLEEAHVVVKVTDVVALPVEDQAGGLADLLQKLDGCQVEYMYAFTFGTDNRAIMVFRFADPDKALAQLAGSDVDLLGEIPVLK